SVSCPTRVTGPRGARSDPPQPSRPRSHDPPQVNPALAYRWNRVRNRWRIFGLRMCGIQVGRNVYIGRRVEFHVSPGAAVTIGDDCVINDYTAFFIGPSASLSIGPRT